MTSLLQARAGLPQVVRAGGRSLRVARWPGRERSAQVGPVPGEALPTPALVRAAVEELADLGYDDVLTTALAPQEHEPFVAAGFDERDRLVLLRRDLSERLEPVALRIRSARRREWPALARLDARAFAPGWGLDAGGVSDAYTATPWARVRAYGRPADGYAVTGRSSRRGYLQRLAVDPTAQRQGVATALVIDALTWLKSRGATEAMVNTGEGNTAALVLYERLGFRPLPHRLSVLGRTAPP